MKTKGKMIHLVILLGLGIFLSNMEANAHRWHHYEPFYYELLPYGNWVNTPDYGIVWIPDFKAGFQPYVTDGQWVYSNFGWTWVSSFNWGWAPFHYGRWYYDPWYGWAWVPGYEWGPGWVAWSHCDGYYGWAPLAPGFSFDRPIPPSHYLPASNWVYVSVNHFGEPFRAEHMKRGHEAERLHANARIITQVDTEKEGRTRFFRGPEIQEVRKATGREFRPTDSRKDYATHENAKRIYQRSTEHRESGNAIRNSTTEIYRNPATRNSKPTGSDPGISSRRENRTYSGEVRKGRYESNVKEQRVQSPGSVNHSTRDNRYNLSRDHSNKR